ncbi:MAG: MFS transporter [Verrucomicrobia bacterium]|nr:MFS transporter [Verrucomicrobiota bacterium]MBU1733984.1 MFS transporter [Verrucomicrobiota bacterium]MBU1857965.1 MFS transporter [Verrucomicrobiota bacterium]
MQDLTNVQKIRAFPWYFGGQATTVVFAILTWFSGILPLFLNALGFSKTQIGVILSLPWFFSLLSLLVAGWVVRRGVKRIFLWCFGMRTIVTVLLGAAPWILVRYGVSAAFIWVSGVSVAFSLCRAVGETSFFPWAREMIPNHLRGKTDAINAIICGVFSLVTAWGSSLVLKYVHGLNGYSLLVFLSIPFGLIAVFAFAMIPGGRPVRVEVDSTGWVNNFMAVMKDRNFLLYEGGIGLFSLAVFGLSFMPLYMQDQVGLRADQVLLLGVVFWFGVLASSYLWGWSGDRFGSKPVLLSGLVLTVLFPVILFFLPRASAWSLTAAMVAYVYWGIAVQGYNAGSGRYLFVGAIPPDGRNSAYYSVHYAFSGLCAAVAPLGAGWILDQCRTISLTWRFVHVDQFSPLFGFSLLFMAGAAVLYSRMRKDGSVRPGEFMFMFIQGNPIMAFNSMIRYRFAADEGDRLSTTRHMGDAENPLSMAELVEAITDPSFNVRYEAIVAMARMPSQEPLTNALIAVLKSQEPDLSVAAGWALGRIADKRAIPALRQALHSEYALLRSRSARSLANLGDVESVPLLRELLKSEKHDGIRVAYASALGVFRAEQALDDLVALLQRLANDSLRGEVALAIARIIGDEHQFVRLWRSTRSDFGTGCAQALAILRKRIAAEWPFSAPRDEALDTAEQALAAQDLDVGAESLGCLIRYAPLDRLPPRLASVLGKCGCQLEQSGAERKEYVLLTLTAIHAALATKRR